MQKVIPARFYRIGSTGPEPVKEWLYSLSPEEKQKIGRAIRLIELGWSAFTWTPEALASCFASLTARCGCCMDL